MRLRLTQFGQGIRFALEPGWYELPSHLRIDERRRLLDMLATFSSMPKLIECSWSELEVIEDELDLETYVLVSIPGEIEDDVREQQLRQSRPRVGLYVVERPGRWPEDAWDEREVKTPLAAFLRRIFHAPIRAQVSKSDAPQFMRSLGTETFPVDRLSAATSEPVELLVLVEMTIEFASRQRRRDGVVDWERSAVWSIGRRLAGRLNEAEASSRAALAELLVGAVEGELPPLVDVRLRRELVRLGLAHFVGGDALLVPLARHAGDPEVRRLLEAEGVFEVPRVTPIAERQQRASTPAEAALVLNPLVEVGPRDPWFVDLREHLPWVRGFCDRFTLLLDRRDPPVRLAVVHQPGSGADTMVRRLLWELKQRGLAVIPVDGLRSHVDSFVDIILAMIRAVIEWAELDHRVELPPSSLSRMRAWFAEISAEGELRDYFLLGATFAGPSEGPAVVALLRHFEGNNHARERLGAQTRELLDHLRVIIDELRAQLIERGVQLCLHVESFAWVEDEEWIDENLLSRIRELESLRCHLVFGFGFGPQFMPAERSVGEVMLALTYPEAPGVDDERSGRHCAQAVEALLAARIVLEAVFDDPTERLGELATNAGGRVADVLWLARLACSRAGDVVGAGDVAAAINEAVELLAANVPAWGWKWLVRVSQTETLTSHNSLMFDRRLLRARESEGKWAVSPLVATRPEYEMARRYLEAEEVWAAGDYERGVALFREVVEFRREAGLPHYHDFEMTLIEAVTSLLACERPDARQLDAAREVALMSEDKYGFFPLVFDLLRMSSGDEPSADGDP